VSNLCQKSTYDVENVPVMFLLLSFLFAFKDKGKFFLQSCSRIYRSKFINLKVTYLAKTT